MSSLELQQIAGVSSAPVVLYMEYLETVMD